MDKNKLEFFSNLGISFLIDELPKGLVDNLTEAFSTHIKVDRLKLWLNNKPIKLTRDEHQEVNNEKKGKKINKRGQSSGYHGETSNNKITFFTSTTQVNPVINILHEFGHLVNNLWDKQFTKELQKETFLLNGIFFAGWDKDRNVYNSLYKKIDGKDIMKQSRIAGGKAWQQIIDSGYNEDWADIFSNYILQNFNEENEVGKQILDFAARMEAHVKESSGPKPDDMVVQEDSLDLS